MKRFLLPILLLLLLAAAVGAGFWLLAPSKQVSSAEAAAAAAEAPAKPEAGAPVALEGPGVGEAKASSERSAELAVLPSAAGVLRGEIRQPSGIQDPGPIVVYALAERANYREFVRLVLREAPQDEAPKKDDDGEGQRILAQTEAAGGRFELALPEGTTKVHLALQGRFLYLERTREVDLRRVQPLQLVPRAGAFLKGSVLLPEGASSATLEALRVELTPVVRGAMAMRPDAPPRLKVRAPGGAFEMRAVPIDAGYRLMVQTDAFALVEDEVENLRAGETRSFELHLEPGGTLRGVVRRPDGQPAEGAKVAAAREGNWFGVDDRKVREAKSGSDGSFELAHVPAGTLKLRAQADGLLPSEKKELELGAGMTTEGVVLELREGASVSGHAQFADGKPAAGADVKLGFDLAQIGGMGAFNAMEGAEGQGKADDEGRFTIHGLGKGPFTVRASSLPAGMQPSEGKKPDEDALLRARADGVTPGTKDLELVLLPGDALRGKVLDAEQKPVTKFQVHAQREGKGMLPGLGQDTEKRKIDDAEGRFLVGGLAQGSWKVWAEAEGFASGTPAVIALPQAPGAPEITLVLARCGVVSGRVVDPQGAPVASANVRIDTGGPDWQRALGGGPPAPEAECDAEGRFRLDGLEPGQLGLTASSREHARSVPLTVTVAASQETKDITLTLRVGGSISGEVYDEQGKPQTGMFVQGTQLARYDTHIENSDGQGHFRFEHLEPGTYQVVAFAAKALGKAGEDQGAAFMGGMKMATAEVKDGEDTHVVLGAPPADPVQVIGRVTHAGEPYAGALVSFVHEGKDVISRMKNVSVDAQGNFEVRLDEPGRYAVSVQKLTGGMGQQNMTEFQRDIPKEKRYELALEMPTGRISGKVLAPDGNPSKGERVSLHPHSAIVGGSIWGGMYVEALTDGEGRFDLQALRAGDYVLSVGGLSMGGMFGGEAAHGRELRSDLKLREGDWLRDIDFKLRKPGKVDVLVVGEDDQPIANAPIFARDAGGFLLDRLSMIATDERGLAHYGGLAPGEYTFSSRYDVRASAEGARIKLTEGESKTVKLVLQGATTLLVSVQDREGQTVQAAVSVTDSTGHDMGGMFGMAELMAQFTKNGLDFSVARVGPLPPGKYTVSARTSDGKTGTKPVTLTGQPERKLTLRVD